jgi:hypothetical protein
MTILKCFDVFIKYIKTLKMKHYLILILGLTFILTSCSEDQEPTGNPPGLFSVNTVEDDFDGATIEWTEAIDPDDDVVTYAVILEGIEVDSGLTNLIYTFNGLESETVYTGYVEARDGNGNTSRADFFFTTLPEAFTYTADLTFIEFEIPTTNACPDGVNTAYEIDMGVLVPKFEGNVSYLVEFSEFYWPHNDSTTQPADRFWTNSDFNELYIYDYNDDYYYVWGTGVGYSCSNNSLIAQHVPIWKAIQGSADITIVLKSN